MPQAPVAPAAPIQFSFSTIPLRVVMRDGEPWFVAADVCKALQIVNTSDALARLDNDEQALVSNEGIHRGTDPVNAVNESGLYNLILGSRKLEAKRFKKWVTSEVLPAIRKTGSYRVNDSSAVDAHLAANRLYRDAIATTNVIDNKIAHEAAVRQVKEATGIDLGSIWNLDHVLLLNTSPLNAELRRVLRCIDQLGPRAPHSAVLKATHLKAARFAMLINESCMRNLVTANVSDGRYVYSLNAGARA